MNEIEIVRCKDAVACRLAAVIAVLVLYALLTACLYRQLVRPDDGDDICRERRVHRSVCSCTSE